MITRGDVGGAQTHVVELTAAQLLGGDQVAVVAGTDGPAMERARQHGVEVRIVPPLGRMRARGIPRPPLGDVRAALMDLSPDIVHGHSSHAGLVARIVARRLRVPCVYTAHGWPFQRGAPWLQRVTSYVGEFVGGHIGGAVICVSQSEADRAVRAHVVDRQRVWVIPNGVADVPPELRRTFGGGPLEIVMVARFAPPKQQRALIDVLAGLTDLDWTVTFVGDGPRFGECAAHGARVLGERARFLGHRDDVSAVLAGSDVSILWSDYEGLPVSMIEAMRAGLCCVGSDLPGVRALLLEPAVGVLAATPADLERELRTLFTDRSRIRELGGLARQRYVQHYSAAAMAAATRSLYEALRAE